MLEWYYWKSGRKWSKSARYCFTYPHPYESKYWFSTREGKKSNRIQSQCKLICKIGHTLCNLVSSLCNISDFIDKINFINAWGKNLNIIYVFQKISVMHCTYLAGEYKKKSSKSKSEIIVNIASYAGLVKKSHIDVFNVETSYVLYYLLNNFLFMIVSWR